MHTWTELWHYRTWLSIDVDMIGKCWIYVISAKCFVLFIDDLYLYCFSLLVYIIVWIVVSIPIHLAYPISTFYLESHVWTHLLLVSSIQTKFFFNIYIYIYIYIYRHFFFMYTQLNLMITLILYNIILTFMKILCN